MTSHTDDWILLNLNRVRNACQYIYDTPATIEHTQRGVPYISVGGGKVRIVFFAKTRRMRVFCNLVHNEPQMHFDFTVARQSDSEYKVVAAFAKDTVDILES